MSSLAKLGPGVAGLSWTYAAAILTFFALRALFPELPPPLALLNSLAPFVFLPLLLFVPLALWARSRSALIAGAIVLILFAGLYGPLFVPRPASGGCEANPGLRVMTLNLGWHLGRGDDLLAIIEEQGPDVVGVQEITPAMAALFEQRLQATYPYMVLRPGEQTTGLLSRYPILTEDWIDSSGGGRPTLHALLDWDGVALNVFVMHPWAPGLEWAGGTLIPIGLHDAIPQRLVVEVATLTAATEGPTLLLGDLNITDHTPAYTRVANLLVDTFREAGWGFGFTFPNDLRIGGIPIPGPLIRLDYIFRSEGLCTQWARVGCGGGSDHCYVVAQLAR